MPDFFPRLSYTDLPIGLSSLFSKQDFLTACTVPDTKRYFAWFLDRHTNKGREIEFDGVQHHVIKRPQREAELPPCEEIKYVSQDVKVVRSWHLDQDTDKRIINLDIFSLDQNERITQVQEHFVSPVFDRDEGGVVKRALERAAFPRLYKTWTLNEKTDYWAGVLQYYRLQTLKAGAHEDDVFSSELIDSLYSLDKNIMTLIPSIIGKLAKSEKANEEVIMHAFSYRTRQRRRL